MREDASMNLLKGTFPQEEDQGQILEFTMAFVLVEVDKPASGQFKTLVEASRLLSQPQAQEQGVAFTASGNCYR